MRTYTINGRPVSSTNSKRILRVGKDKRVVIVKSQEAVEWSKSATVQLLAQRQGPCIEGPVEVELDVYRDRNWGDLDNFAKGVLDALQQAMVYRNDVQVMRLTMEKFLDRTNPRIVARVTERPAQGVLIPLEP